MGRQVLCEVEMKRMCLSQANADLAEAAEKLEALRKKLAVRPFQKITVVSFFLLRSTNSHSCGGLRN